MGRGPRRRHKTRALGRNFLDPIFLTRILFKTPGGGGGFKRKCLIPIQSPIFREGREGLLGSKQMTLFYPKTNNTRTRQANGRLA